MNYYLVKQQNKDGTKSFDSTLKIEDKDKLEQVEHFTKKINSMGIEIFKIEGATFITSEGILFIVREDEIKKV